MHARVITGKVQMDKTDESIALFRDNVVPAAKEQKGFKEAHLFTQQDTGKYIVLTIWETEEDIIAGDTSGYLQEQLGKVAANFADSPVIEHYEYSVKG